MIKTRITLSYINPLSCWKTLLPVCGFWGMILGTLGGIFLSGLFADSLMFWQWLFLGMWFGCLGGLGIILLVMSYNLVAAFFGGISFELEELTEGKIQTNINLSVLKHVNSR